MHEPKRVYYEEAALNYELGKMLREKYAQLKWIPIETHNNIPELRQNPNSEFAKMKQAIVVAVRKTHKFVPNRKTSDYLVPYTSSAARPPAFIVIWFATTTNVPTFGFS